MMELDRRTFMSFVAAGAAAQLAADVAIGQNPVREKIRDKAADAKQYEVCKQRGHIPDPAAVATFIAPPVMQQAPSGYVAHSETPWQVCYYCHKDYRFVTKIEEREHEG